MLQRPRRNRQSAVIRDMVEETRLSVKDMLFPLFVQSGTGKQTAIASMPGINRYSVDLL
jgi:porphobilinogen synthase